MRSGKILLGLLQAVLAAGALVTFSSCASTDDDVQVAHPTDSQDSKPWNRPNPGEDAQRFGGLPQSR